MSDDLKSHIYVLDSWLGEAPAREWDRMLPAFKKCWWDQGRETVVLEGGSALESGVIIVHRSALRGQAKSGLDVLRKLSADKLETVWIVIYGGSQTEGEEIPKRV